MGTWGTGIFDNDTASDWAFGLEGKSDLAYVDATLEKVLRAGNAYLEAPDAEEALAAAETVAILLGRGGAESAYSEPVEEWVASTELSVDAALSQKAIRAIDRILTEPSEALELWQEGDDLDAWKSTLNDLKGRLAG